MLVAVLALVIDYATPCSDGEVQLGNDGQLYVISSPYFPDVYTQNLDCVYHMVAPGGMYVRYRGASRTLEGRHNLEIQLN